MKAWKEEIMKHKRVEGERKGRSIEGGVVVKGRGRVG